MVPPEEAKILNESFELLSIVGRGRGTVVFHSRMRSPNAEIALKVLNRHKHEQALRNRLKHEAQLLLLAEHEHIIKLHGFDVLGQNAYLALEFARGGDLLHYSKAGHNNRLNPTQAELFFRQALQALVHLQSIGITHRDIKPENILVIDEHTCKLADFGVSECSQTTHDTSENATVGTLSYLSPEVLEGARCNHQSDLYALALSFYHLIAGFNPFDDIPLIEQLELRKTLKIKHLSDICPALSSNTADVIMQMLSYNPAQRHKSASEILTLLQQSQNYASLQTTAATKPSGSLNPKVEATQHIPTPRDLRPRGGIDSMGNFLDKTLAVAETTILSREKIKSMVNQMEDQHNPDEGETQVLPSKVLSQFRMADMVNKEGNEPLKGLSDRSTCTPPDPFDQATSGRRKQRLGKMLIAFTLTISIIIGFALLIVGYYPTSSKSADNQNEQTSPEATQGNDFTSGFVLSSPSEPLRGPEITTEAQPAPTEEPLIDSAPERKGQNAAINLELGLHVGSIEGLFPQTPTHISLIVLPEGQGTEVLIGVEGWSPQRIETVFKLGEAVRVASNGIVLQLSFEQSDQGVSGMIEDMSTGRQGRWSVSKSKW